MNNAYTQHSSAEQGGDHQGDDTNNETVKELSETDKIGGEVNILLSQQATAEDKKAKLILRFVEDTDALVELMEIETPDEFDDLDDRIRNHLYEIFDKEWAYQDLDKCFAEMWKILMGSRVGEEEKELFQRNVHSAWMSYISKKDSPTINFNRVNESTLNRGFWGLYSYVLREEETRVFLPVIIEKLQEHPHLGITSVEQIIDMESRSRELLPGGNMVITPEVAHTLSVHGFLNKILKNKDMVILEREFKPSDFNDIPSPYDKFIKPDTETVTVSMFTDHNMLWKFKDSEEEYVIRPHIMKVPRETVLERVGSLPSCIPETEVSFRGNWAYFKMKYVNGNFANPNDATERTLVLDTIETLQEIEWFLCNDPNANNFIISDIDTENPIAFWVDQQIYSSLVNDIVYTQSQRAEAPATCSPEHNVLGDYYRNSTNT